MRLRLRLRRAALRPPRPAPRPASRRAAFAAAPGVLYPIGLERPHATAATRTVQDVIVTTLLPGRRAGRFWGFFFGHLQRAGRLSLAWGCLSAAFCAAAATLTGAPVQALDAVVDAPWTANAAARLEALPDDPDHGDAASAALLFLWQRSRSRPRLHAAPALPAIVASPALCVDLLAMRLVLPYRVRHRGLNRKLRKIVKNKYRYVRTYEWISPSQRIRHGVRLAHALLPLEEGRTLTARAQAPILGFFVDPEESPLLRLHARHSAVVVAQLAARHTRDLMRTRLLLSLSQLQYHRRLWGQQPARLAWCAAAAVTAAPAAPGLRRDLAQGWLSPAPGATASHLCDRQYFLGLDERLAAAKTRAYLRQRTRRPLWPALTPLVPRIEYSAYGTRATQSLNFWSAATANAWSPWAGALALRYRPAGFQPNPAHAWLSQACAWPEAVLRWAAAFTGSPAAPQAGSWALQRPRAEAAEVNVQELRPAAATRMEQRQAQLPQWLVFLHAAVASDGWLWFEDELFTRWTAATLAPRARAEAAPDFALVGHPLADRFAELQAAAAACCPRPSLARATATGRPHSTSALAGARLLLRTSLGAFMAAPKKKHYRRSTPDALAAVRGRALAAALQARPRLCPALASQAPYAAERASPQPAQAARLDAAPLSAASTLISYAAYERYPSVALHRRPAGAPRRLRALRALRAFCRGAFRRAHAHAAGFPLAFAELTLIVRQRRLQGFQHGLRHYYWHPRTWTNVRRRSRLFWRYRWAWWDWCWYPAPAPTAPAARYVYRRCRRLLPAHRPFCAPTPFKRAGFVSRLGVRSARARWDASEFLLLRAAAVGGALRGLYPERFVQAAMRYAYRAHDVWCQFVAPLCGALLRRCVAWVRSRRT